MGGASGTFGEAFRQAENKESCYLEPEISSALGLPRMTARKTAHEVVAPPSVLILTALNARPISTMVASCRFNTLQNEDTLNAVAQNKRCSKLRFQGCGASPSLVPPPSENYSSAFVKCEKHDEMQFELSWRQLFEGQPPTIGLSFHLEAKTSNFGPCSGNTMRDQLGCTYLDSDSKTSPRDPKKFACFGFLAILVNI